MNNWIKSILIGSTFVVGCFVFVKCKAGARKKDKTVHYVVQVSQDQSSPVPMEELMNRSMTVIKKRLTEAGFQSSIKQAGSDLIDVLVTTDSSGILLTKQMVEASNKLEFREVYMLSEIFPSVLCAADTLKGDAPIDATFNHPATTNNIYSLIALSVEANGRIVDNGTIGRSMVADTGFVTKILNDPKIHKCFPGDIEFCYGPAENMDNASDKKRICNLYAIRTRLQKALLTNDEIKYAETDKGYDGKPMLNFGFSQMGARIFENMTMLNKGRFIAIILDKKVISAPHVESAIEGGTCSIHGNFTAAEADLLAHQLNAGYLPAHLQIVLQELVPEKTGSSN